MIGLLLIIISWQARAQRQLKIQLAQQNHDLNKLEQLLDNSKKKFSQLDTRYERILATSTQALIIIELDYTISSYNKTAKELFGRLHRGETFIRWTGNHELHELLEQVFQGIKTPPLHLSIGGKNLIANARAVKAKGDKQQIIAVAVAIHDISETQRLARARRDFVTNISHELRTPITSLSILTETLLNGAIHEPELALDLIHKIAAQVNSLSQLAQEVLDLALIESGRAPLRLANYPLAEIVAPQIKNLLPQATRKALTVTHTISPDIRVLVDQAMFNRVITNLLHNAIKFTEKGSITVAAQYPFTEPADQTDESWVLVSVTDSGVGILRDNLERLFERFYIADRARSHPESGTGLGLAIAKHIVEAHGGRIWAESDGKTGSTFYFTLPLES